MSNNKDNNIVKDKFLSLNKKDKSIVKDIIKGDTQVKIGKKHNISQSTVSYIKTKYKDIIQNAYYKIIDNNLDKGVESINKIINATNNIEYKYNGNKDESSYNLQLAKIGFYQINKMLESVGISPTHATSQIHNNILIQSDNVQISPLIEGLVKDHMDKVDHQDDVIDVDYDKLE